MRKTQQWKSALSYTLKHFTSNLHSRRLVQTALVRLHEGEHRANERKENKYLATEPFSRIRPWGIYKKDHTILSVER